MLTAAVWCSAVGRHLMIATSDVSESCFLILLLTVLLLLQHLAVNQCSVLVLWLHAILPAAAVPD
jgi:hypothetical protein